MKIEYFNLKIGQNKREDTNSVYHYVNKKTGKIRMHYFKPFTAGIFINCIDMVISGSEFSANRLKNLTRPSKMKVLDRFLSLINYRRCDKENIFALLKTCYDSSEALIHLMANVIHIYPVADMLEYFKIVVYSYLVKLFKYSSKKIPNLEEEFLVYASIEYDTFDKNFYEETKNNLMEA